MTEKAIDYDSLFSTYEDEIPVPASERDVHLVLSGSGVKLFVFVLAVYVLHLLGHRFVKVTGTSGGALVAAKLASVYDPMASRYDRALALRSVVKTAMSINIPDLLDPQWLFWRVATKLSGAIKGRLILKRLRAELPATFSELKMPCEIVAFQVNAVDPRTRIITDGDLPLAVRASMSIPLLFTPVTYGDMLLVDGGWQMNLALPDGGNDVIGLTFATGRDHSLVDIDNNIALGFKLIDGAIDEGMRRAIEQAPHADVIELSTSIGGLDFFVSDDEKLQGMMDGATSVLNWAKSEVP